MRLIAVAVPVPTLDALTYRVPESLPMPVVGARVLVPLGNRTLTGIVVRRNPGCRDGGIRVRGSAEAEESLPPEGGAAERRNQSSPSGSRPNPNPERGTGTPTEPEPAPGTRNRPNPEPPNPNPIPEAGTTAKDIIEVSITPFLPADVVKLASWVADYYASGRGSDCDGDAAARVDRK